MPRIDGFSPWLTVGLLIGVAVAFFRRGSSTGDGKPFSGR